MGPVLVFGTICLDRVRRVPRLPSVGGYVEITDERLLLGGEAANTAFALAAWGVPVRLFGNSLGSGSEAETLRRMIGEKGLPVDLLQARGGATPVCDIYVTPDGERTMFGKGFSTMAGFTDPAEDVYVQGQWFTAEPNLGAVAREVVRKANLAGMQVYTMDFIQDGDPVMPGSFWQSSTDWCGSRGDLDANVAWVERFVAERGCFAILSDGARGLVAGSPDLPVRAYPAFRLTGIVDSTGAGDTFRAGMLYGLASGWHPTRALSFASAAGALACLSLGATTEIPAVEAIEALREAQPEVDGAFVLGA